MLGVIVLAVAIFALRNPKGSHGANNAAASTSMTPTTSATAPSAPASGRGSGVPSGAAGSSSVATIPVRGSSSTISLADAQQVPLVVLNNTTVTGLAQQAAQRFEDAGWTVTQYGNLQNTILSTCAYYDPSDSSAKPAAKALKQEFPTIKRVRPKFPELPSGPIVVVLTPDYSSQ